MVLSCVEKGLLTPDFTRCFGLWPLPDYCAYLIGTAQFPTGESVSIFDLVLSLYSTLQRLTSDRTQRSHRYHRNTRGGILDSQQVKAVTNTL
jgi:hypothetical protein